ncbi:MAG: T9SS type A sorting domain-containing protein [Bacteroidota bacterium]
MKTKLIFLLAVTQLLIPLHLIAREDINGGNRNGDRVNESTAAACSPGTAAADLAVNNVRCRIMNTGDMWWDFTSPQYEVPKGSGKHSMFAGALWIAGVDGAGNLKVAAMTYRQNGVDFWPGPLDDQAGTDQATCNKYDKLWRISRKEVEEFVANGTMTQNILNWPGNDEYGNILAPFADLNGNGIYEPELGEYPAYALEDSTACTGDHIYGDETLWWVFNDRGNIHTESNAEAIGLEVHAQAFGFTTNDEINNMTFYQYKIINKSTYMLTNTYFGQWVDADLGDYLDDYVGCDVGRGLGYCYNGQAVDVGVNGYGANPPAIGVDFFQGPLADDSDNVDNDRDCLVDEPGEQIIMSKFVYYNNDGSATGNPSSGIHIYNYLQGIWKDGTPMTYGGTGHGGNTPCDFMFPGNSDHQWEWGTGGSCNNPRPLQPDWDETNNAPGDRRFLQSAGAFTLLPGAVNTITTGVVWARASSGGPLASVDLLKAADDKAQALFDNCFKVINGPDAPDITIQELDKELILYISNKSSSNNYQEQYAELDPLIITPPNVTPPYDSMYRFQGYQVFQLKDATVSVSDIHNPDRARLLMQCDLKDFRPNGEPIAQLVNYYFDPNLNASVPVEEVNGANAGVIHSFKVTEDLFATGDRTLVNHKQYYYLAVAYAYNEYKKYEQDNPLLADGQKKPYKAGRRNIRVYTGIPHIPSPEANGTVQNSIYGTGPKLKRIEGQGNGGNVLDLTEETVNEILTSPQHRSFHPVYGNSKGPVKIKVVDPLNVPEGDFTFKLNGVAVSSGWSLTNNTTGVTVSSERSIQVGNEQIIPDWGLSVYVAYTDGIGNSATENNGLLEATMTYTDPTKQWLTGVPDFDGENYQNWIRSGKYAEQTGEFNDYNYSKDAQGNLVGTGLDDDEVYEKILGGTWAPYRMCAVARYGPALNMNLPLAGLSKVASVDIVFTSDKSKWTRCPVIELCEETTLAQGGQKKHQLRKSLSVNKEGQPDGSGTYGMGWFPGYAINVETGERLNMAFGENSWLVSENGRDMLWNPTSTLYDDAGNLIMGGQHYIYVFGHNSANDVPAYDEGAYAFSVLFNGGDYNPSANIMKNVYRDAMWVNIPLLAEGRSLLETDVKVRLRVNKPYKVNYAVDGAVTPVNGNNPMYTFNTADLKTQVQDNPAAVDALKLINIVPNPYYGYSEYEKNQVDNRVKITNLPVKCTVKIYTLNGTLIRTIKKDDDSKTSLDWDLKNQAGVPIASGMYIVHVDAPGIGEATLKWFGVMRPQDLDTF